jgi:hypothetical protein
MPRVGVPCYVPTSFSNAEAVGSLHGRSTWGRVYHLLRSTRAVVRAVRSGNWTSDRTSANADVLRSAPKPRCQVHPFHKRSPITLSISYTANPKPSNAVASSLSRGFRAPENTFLARSSLGPPLTSRRGRRHSQILRTHPHVIHILCTLALRASSPPWMQEMVLGFGRSITSSGCRYGAVCGTRTSVPFNFSTLSL